MTTTEPSFTNPYEGLPCAQRTRTTIDVATRDKAFLDSLHGRKGTIQTTINILVQKTIHELRRNNITSYDPDAFESAIAGVVVVLGGRSAPSNPDTHPETPPRNDDGGAPGVARVPARPAQSADPRGSSKGTKNRRTVQTKS